MKITPERLEVLRAAVRQRIADAGLRSTARELGMSPGGVRKFVDGTQPYGPTVDRLLAWYGEDDAARERRDKIAAFVGLIPDQRRAAAVPLLDLLLSGSTTSADGRRAREAAEAALLMATPTNKRPLASALLGVLSARSRVVPPRTDRDADFAVLTALLDALASHLPIEAKVRVAGRQVAGRIAVDALRNYVDGQAAG